MTHGRSIHTPKNGVLARVLWVSALTGALWTAGCGDDGPDMPDTPDAAPPSETPPDGLWHFQVTFPDAPGFVNTGVLRIDAGEVSILGSSAEIKSYVDRRLEVEWTRRDLVFTVVSTLGDDGSITGTTTVCNPSECGPAGELSGRKVEPLDEPVAEGITLVSEYNGPETGEWRANGDITVNVRVHEGMAYLARYGDGLRIVDLADPSKPVERGHVPVAEPEAGEFYNDVKIIEGPPAMPDGEPRVYAIMASSTRGGVVIDVTDPAQAAEVTTFPEATPELEPSAHTLYIEGTRLYLADTTLSGLGIYDLADPTAPQFLGQWVHPDLGTLGGYLHDLYIENGRAYLNYWNLGMIILDTQADPANPTLVGEYQNYGEVTSHSSWVTRVAGRTVAIHGDEQYGAHVRIVDVDNESVAFLDTIGSYETRPEISVHNVMAHENLALLTYYQDGVRVLDLEDPSAPKKIAHYHTWPGPGPGYGESFYEGAIGIDFDPDTRTIYVADTHRGLFVLTLD